MNDNELKTIEELLNDCNDGRGSSGSSNFNNNNNNNFAGCS